MIIRHVQLVGDEAEATEIVVSDGVFARVGEASDDPSRDGPLLTIVDAIAFPGLTNSHDHLEYNLYSALGHGPYADYVEWSTDIQRRDAHTIAAVERVPRALRLRWGALKNLVCGVTAVAHHGRSRDRLASLPVDIIPGTSIHSARFAPLWRLRLNTPVDRSPYVFHVGEGASPQVAHEVDAVLRWNLFQRRLIGVHAIAMHREQAERFHAVVWCPVSNEFLYGKTADIASLKRATAIVFGTDSTLTGGWNFWTHLRRARALGLLDDRELFDAVTRTAARIWRRSKTGSIAPGSKADLVVAKKKRPNRWDAFFAVDPEDILLVLRGGAVVLCDASLDWAPRGGPFSSQFSTVRIGASEKLVADDVPAICGAIRSYGIAPNTHIAVDV
jgi:cytosine/adenosine deaminase-related metal-dependent hydrolase